MSYQGELKEKKTKTKTKLSTENSWTELPVGHFLDVHFTVFTFHTAMESEFFSS